MHLNKHKHKGGFTQKWKWNLPFYFEFYLSKVVDLAPLYPNFVLGLQFFLKGPLVFKRHSTVGWNFEPTGKNQISIFCPNFNYLKCFESPIAIIGHPDRNYGLQSDFKKIGPKPMVIGVILGVRQFQCQSSRNLSRCQVMIKFEKFRYF